MRPVWLGVGLVVVALLSVVSVTTGSRDVSWSEIWAGVQGSTDTIGEAAVVKRVPRTVMALLAGAALGVSGAVMQGVTRNPLADPGILGVNAGAAFAVVVAMAWFNIALSTPTYGRRSSAPRWLPCSSTPSGRSGREARLR